MAMRIDVKISEDEVKELLVRQINTGKLILVDPVETRQMGITKALIEVGELLDLPIVVANNTQADLLRGRISRDGKRTRVMVWNTVTNEPSSAPKGVLIETGLTTKELDSLRAAGVRIRSGFFDNHHF